VPEHRSIALVVVQLPAHPAKQRAYEDIGLTRPDWMDGARFDAMRLVLWLKAVQHPPFAETLVSTGKADIVEYSSRGDTLWGAVPIGRDRKTLIGSNALGKLLCEVRTGLLDGQDEVPAELEERFSF